MKKVLILTNKKDITADYVVAELQKRGSDYFRFNTEDFPQKVIGNFSLLKGKSVMSFQTPKGKIVLNDVGAVWYRRPGKPSITEINELGMKEFCKKESQEFLEGLYLNFKGIWISFPPSIFQAQNKLYQLQTAKDIGFKIPLTTVTNDPQTASKFIKNISGTVIAKAVRQGILKMNKEDYLMFTNPITNEDLETISNIRWSPVILQEFIPKKFDLRITVVGDSVFPVEIHTDPEDMNSQFDWRKANQQKLVYKIHKLPSKVEILCKKLVNIMNLNFGAIDMVYSEHGGYHFLEINPNGQWVWIEQKTGLPLTKALVDLLIQEKKT